MRSEPDTAFEADTPIFRRVDGSIDTETYFDRARGLRSACQAEALSAILRIRAWHRPTNSSPAK